jgi:hypothetical protein
MLGKKTKMYSSVGYLSHVTLGERDAFFLRHVTTGRVRVLRCRGRVRALVVPCGSACPVPGAPVGVSRALEPACPCRVVPCLPHPTSRSWCAVTWGSSLVVCAF